MTTHHYQLIRACISRSGKCPVCGKRTTRSRTFEQTLNPFNVNDDGNPKTAHEVRADVEDKAHSWAPDFTHEKCAEEVLTR